MFQAIFAIVKTAGKRGTSWQTHKRASASSLPLALYVSVQHFVVHQGLSATRQDVFTIVKTSWQTWYKPAQKLAGKRGTTWQNIQTRYIYDRKQHIVLCCELTLIMVNIACLWMFARWSHVSRLVFTLAKMACTKGPSATRQAYFTIAKTSWQTSLVALRSIRECATLSFASKRSFFANC